MVVSISKLRNSSATVCRLLREAAPQCGLDTSTAGHVCQGGPGSQQLTVCGMCGMLFETSYPRGAHRI